MKFDDSVWEKWESWIRAIKSDLSLAVNDRALFTTFSSVVNANSEWIKEHHGYRFCHFVYQAYAARTAFGIRRHCKKNTDSISLARLLDQVARCAPHITFEYYLSRFPPEPHYVDWQTTTFRQLSADGDTVSAEMVRGDLDELMRAAQETEQFCDRVLAHLDPRGHSDRLSFASMHEAVQRFNDLTCKYLGFLGGDGYQSLEAVVQYRWEQIFSVPLKKPPP